MKNPRASAAVIFDFDGVLVDSEPLYNEAQLRMWRRRHLVLPRSYRTFISRQVLGTTERVTFTRFKRLFRLKDQIHALMAERDLIVARLLRTRLRPVPGVSRLVRSLAPQFRLAITSSSFDRIIEQALRKFRISRYFPIIVTAEDIRGSSKPAPGIYLATARALRLPPSRCVVIEDSPNGVLSAKRAGMACIALKHANTTRRDLARADRIVTTLSPVTPEMIKSLLGRA